MDSIWLLAKLLAKPPASAHWRAFENPNTIQPAQHPSDNNRIPEGEDLQGGRFQKVTIIQWVRAHALWIQAGFEF